MDYLHYRLMDVSDMKEGWVIKLASIDRRRVEYDDVATSNLLSGDQMPFLEAEHHASARALGIP